MPLKVNGNDLDVEACIEFLQDLEAQILYRLEPFERSRKFREGVVQTLFLALCEVINKRTERLESPWSNFLKELESKITEGFSSPMTSIFASKGWVDDDDNNKTGLDEQLREIILQVLELLDISSFDLQPSQKVGIERIVWEQTRVAISLP